MISCHLDGKIPTPRQPLCQVTIAHDFLKQMMIGVFLNFLFRSRFQTRNNKKANLKPVASTYRHNFLDQTSFRNQTNNHVKANIKR